MLLSFISNIQAKNLEEKKREFSYARSMKVKSTKRYLFPLFLIAFFFSLGYYFGQKRAIFSINREAIVHTSKSKAKIHMLWKDLANNTLFLENLANQKYEKKEVDLRNVRKIILYPPPKPQEEIRELRKDEKNFLGRYRIQVGLHKGLFYIYKRRTGRIGASVRFTNWGKQEVEFLQNVRVWKNKIYFRRRCKGKRCFEIGSSLPINQKFQGKLFANRKEIVGVYSGGHSGSQWKAKRY